MTSIVKWTGIALAVLFGLTLAAGLALYPVGMEQLTRTYPDIPDDALDIPGDSEAVARGRHVATIWACAMCHGADLSGTMLTDDWFQGTVPAANLTAGKGGIGGSYADADWIRAIRHGVKPDRHVEVWMNDYSSLSDQDLGALIAYHIWCRQLMVKLRQGNNAHSQRWYRFFNEVPALLLMGIVVLAVVKPF